MAPTFYFQFFQVCDCFHLTSFNLFMDWTGECFGLPSTPTTDLLSKVVHIFCKEVLSHLVLSGLPGLVCYLSDDN